MQDKPHGSHKIVSAQRATLFCLGMVGALPKSHFPDASQRPTPQAALSKGGCPRPALLPHFCTWDKAQEKYKHCWH